MFNRIDSQLASELWPEAAEDIDDGSQEPEGSLEDQIAKELAVIKRPRKNQPFGTSLILFASILPTDLLCSQFADKHAMRCVQNLHRMYQQLIFVHQVIFISCKPPVDPVRLVMTHIQNVKRSGITQTK